MHPPGLLPLSSLERLVLNSDTDYGEGTFEEQCERFRLYLRNEVAARNGSVASGAHVPVVEPAAVDWGQVLDNFGPDGIAEFVEQLGVSTPAEFAALR